LYRDIEYFGVGMRQMGEKKIKPLEQRRYPQIWESWLKS
jgi:hypothetical protein